MAWAIQYESMKKGFNMTLNDLDNEQRLILKQRLLVEKWEAHNRTPNYGELAEADKIITDKELEQEYNGVEFVEEDF